MIIEAFKRFLKRMERKEYYTTLSPEEFEKFVPRGAQLELAELRKQVMLLRKELEKKNEIIQKLEEELKQKKEEDIQKALELMREIEEENRYDLFFSKPIRVVSLKNTTFVDRNGRPLPYLAGFRFETTPYGTRVKLILSDNNNKEKAILPLEPPLYIEQISQLFWQPELFVDFLRRGVVKINVLPDGTRIIPQKLRFRYEEGS